MRSVWLCAHTPLARAGQEVQAYLVAYARDAGLLPYIRLHADVKAVTPIGDAGEEGWLITYEQDGGEPLT